MPNRKELIVPRRGNEKLQGIFSLSSSHRPNPILISYCEILEINKNILVVNRLEALDDSILLDIKISRD